MRGITQEQMKTIFVKPKLVPEFKRAQPLPFVGGDFAGQRGMPAPIGSRVAASMALRLEAFNAKPHAVRGPSNLGAQITGLAA